MRIALLCFSMLACAAEPTHVRAPDGAPLPTTARIDADAALTVTCGDARYLIVAPPPPYVAGMHVATERPYVHDLPALCARIRATD
jgi:hypothetical protein